jgi:SAM-dependent methyltransferase
MRPGFPLFQSHLDLAHELWKDLVTPEALVVDATCGNGHDALFLATLAHRGKVILFDVQPQAIQNSRERLQKALDPAHFNTISFHELCHSKIDEVVPPASAKLIIFNLGYLPGHDKSITTRTKSTLISLEKCLDLVCPGGAISLTCYPGHTEGKKELEEITSFCRELSPKEWSVCAHCWLNRTLHPNLIFLQKAREMP